MLRVSLFLLKFRHEWRSNAALLKYLPAVCETEILKTHANTISEMVVGEPFQLVELGAGNGEKTQILIRKFINNKSIFQYYPIDISHGAVSNLVKTMEAQYENDNLEVTGLIGDYFVGLKSLPHIPKYRKFVLFLGITLNNLTFREAKLFLRRLHNSLNEKDLVLIGFDLKKDPRTLNTSYNDSEGLFEKLNLHLLERINQKLGGNFNKNLFLHQSHYNPRSNALECFLYSKKNQTVRLSSLGKDFNFKEWEGLQTEQSYKYSIEKI